VLDQVVKRVVIQQVGGSLLKQLLAGVADHCAIGGVDIDELAFFVDETETICGGLHDFPVPPNTIGGFKSFALGSGRSAFCFILRHRRLFAVCPPTPTLPIGFITNFGNLIKKYMEKRQMQRFYRLLRVACLGRTCNLAK
jgi:hypothetical protein